MLSPYFFGCHNVKSMIHRSHGIQMNDMNNVMCFINYDMCFVKYVMCCLQKDKFEIACYTHGMTFQIIICQVH